MPCHYYNKFIFQLNLNEIYPSFYSKWSKTLYLKLKNYNLMYKMYQTQTRIKLTTTTTITCLSLQIFIKIIHNAFYIFYVKIKYNYCDE